MPIPTMTPTFRSKKVRIHPNTWLAHPHRNGQQLAPLGDGPMPPPKLCSGRIPTGAAVERSLPPASVNRGSQLSHSALELVAASEVPSQPLQLDGHPKTPVERLRTPQGRGQKWCSVYIFANNGIKL